MKEFKLKPKKSYIIDIGSNDGVALKPFKELGFKNILGIEPAKNLRILNKAKKIDVFDKYGNKITSVGARGYADYPTYLNMFGKAYADKRRKLYKIRHNKDRHIKGSAGYYADQLLW